MGNDEMRFDSSTGTRFNRQTLAELARRWNRNGAQAPAPLCWGRGVGAGGRGWGSGRMACAPG